MGKTNEALCAAVCAIIVFFLLPFCSFAVNAESAPEAPEIVDSGICGAKGDNLKWTLDEDGTLTISGSGKMYDYRDEDSPFCSNGEINTVIIEDGVTSIGDAAFDGCAGLDEIVIPNSVASIGEIAFNGCYRMGEIAISAGVASIGSWAFYGCDSLTDILYGGSKKAWSSLTDGFDLGYDDFDVTVHYNAKTTPVIRENSGTCGDGVIWTLDEDGTLTVSGSGDMEDYCAASDADSYSWKSPSPFSGDKRIKKVVIENGVSHIGDYAFENCKKLTIIYVPGSVCDYRYDPDPEDWCGTETVHYGFGRNITYGCGNLGVIYYDGGVDSLRESCDFEDRFDPRNNTLYYNGVPVCCDYHSCGAQGDNVTWTIDANGTLTVSGKGDMADYGECDVFGFGEPVFLYYPKIQPFSGQTIRKVVVEEGVTGIGGLAFCGCGELEEVVLPEGLKRIGTGAFNDADSLAKISLPESVSEIGYLAFDGTAYCDNADNWTDGALYLDGWLIKTDPDAIGKKHTVKAGTKGIANSAFLNAEKLQSVTLPDGISYVEDCAFFGCSGLKDITIPTGTKYVGSYAFAKCGNLTSVIIPDSVMQINDSTFINCENLTDIYFAGSKEEWKTLTKNKHLGYDEDVVTVHYNRIPNETGLKEIGTTDASVTEELFTEELTTDETTSYVLCDVNMDGKITAQDARLALRAVARLEALSELQLLLADADGNGKLKAGDARLILRIAAKLDPTPGYYIEES